MERARSTGQVRGWNKRSVAIAIAWLLAFAGSSALADGNLLPAAHAGSDASGSVGQTFGFSGNASHDPDGSIVSYEWTFGDGATASGPYVTHAFASLGTYTVTLTVTDNEGGIGTDTAAAYVCPSIRNAIDAAQPGAIIQLQPCTYVEKVLVNKSVTLQGATGVIFDGSIGQANFRNGPVFQASANNVTLRDMTIRNWNSEYIYAAQSGLRLLNLTATGVNSINIQYSGSTLIDSSSLGPTYINAYGTGGLTVRETTANTISANQAQDFRIVGVSANSLDLYNAKGRVERSTSYVGASGDVTIEYSTLRGASLSGGVTLRTSEVAANSANCPNYYFAGPITVERNQFRDDCGRTVYVYISGTNAILRYNQFNSGGLTFQSSSSQGFAYLNNFVAGASARDDGFDNRFDTGSLGNHWADHTSPDANNDSVVDTPRNVTGNAGSRDNFPLVAPFGGVPNVTAVPPDLTPSPDALVDANLGVLIPMTGLELNASYDLTISNITPSGVGFGYGYGGGYAIDLELHRPNGTFVDEQAHYADAIHAGKVNVSFPARTLDAIGEWTLTANGFTIVSFFVDPPFFPPTSAPNPSGANASVRAYDVQEMRVSFPSDARLEMQRNYDLTFTNITTVGGTHEVRAPNGTTTAVADTSADGLHNGRLNVTYANISFAVSGVWTLRGPNNATIAAFDVDAPPGVNPFVVPFALTLGNRTDGAAFGAASNATPEFDPAHDVAEPPAPSDAYYVRLFLPTPSGAELHRSVLATNGTLEWNVIANATGLTGTASLTWEANDIAAINSSFDVELIDGPTTVDMRIATSHAFDLDGDHAMTIRLRQAAGLHLAANAVIVTPIVRLGAGLYVNGTVDNDGPNAAVDVTVTLELDNGTNITIPSVPSTIPSGGVGTFSFPANIQTIPGAHTLNVRVASASEDLNLANNVVTKSYFVSTHTIELEVVGATSKNVTLSSNATYDLRVTNTGNVNETFDLSLGATPAGWSAALTTPSVMLAPGSNATITLEVTGPTLVTVEPVAQLRVTGVAASDPTAIDMVDVTTTLIVTRTLAVPGGWSMLSVAVAPSDNTTSAVFGPEALAVYQWNGTGYSVATTVVPGRGYWVFAEGPFDVNVTGIPRRNVTVQLSAGWNLIGTPIVQADLNDAPANVSRTAFRWNLTGYEEAVDLAPLQAYWVYSHNTTSVVTLGETGAGTSMLGASSLRIARAAPAIELALRFSARSGEHDAVALGASPHASNVFGAEDLPKMPSSAASSQVRATLVGLDNGRAIDLQRDVRAPSAYLGWALNVDREGVRSAIDVSWNKDQVDQIPLTYRVELQDGLIRVDMRLVQHYTLSADSPNSHHDLRIVVASIQGEPACATSINGTCIAWIPIDPSRAILGG